jgi:hypothetical protein
MSSQFLTLTFATFILACGPTAADAQQAPNSPMQEGERQSQQGQRLPPGRYSRSDEPDDWDEWRGRGMMDRNPNFGRGWRRHPGSASETTSFGMGIGGPGMVRMMMILMDSDGDGAVSLQEFQAGHERMFKAMDADKDGRLTLEEVQSFGRGLTNPVQQPR